ncbi:MAG TPA: fibronectin type III domain-containing protein, partial [Thermoanaerobaculia bacterium]
MTRRIILILFFSVSLHAQDVLTVASDIAPAGGIAKLPVSILDRTATPLGIDAGSSDRIQAFAFKVLFPTELVTSVAFARAGVAAQVTPLFESELQGSGWSSCIVSFHEATNPLAFHLDTTAPGDRIGTLTVTMRNDAPAGSIARLILDPPSAMLSNRTATTRESVADGTLSLVNGSVTVTALATPASLVATASGTSIVNASWTAVSGTNHYELWRSSNNGAFAIVGSPSAPAFTDATVVANTTYLYRVRAIDGDGDPSAFSNIDAATTIV